MAKRFSDNKLSRAKWFRELRPELKCAFRFLLDECDEAGIWEIDESSMTFHVGARVNLNELIIDVNEEKERLRLVGRNKIWITGFCKFQYGNLSAACKPHQKAISLLNENKLFEEYLKGLGNPTEETLKGYHGRDKDKEEEKVKETEKEKDTDFSKDRLPECLAEWKLTLEHFKITRSILPGEDLTLLRGIKQFGASSVLLAIKGARKEPPSKDYDPKNYCSLNRYLNPTKFPRFVSLGAGADPTKMDLSDIFGGAAS